MTKKIPTHEIENLTNSPYPMRTAAGYDRIVPAFTKVNDIPAPSFFENLNKNFWKVTEIPVSEELKQALAEQAEAEAAAKKAQEEADARIVKQAEEDAIKASEEATKAAESETAALNKEAADKVAAEAAKKGEKK